MKNERALVVFYSFEGNTKFIAQEIQKNLGCDILELEPKEDRKKSGFMKYLWGGKQVVTKKMPELLPYKLDVDKYDKIFVGTPIWASSYAPALRTFFNENEIKGKDIAFFCCHAGGGRNKIYRQYKEALSGNEFLGEIDFKDPLKHNKEEAKKRLEIWLEKLA